MKPIHKLLVTCGLGLLASLAAASSGGPRLDRPAIDRLDAASLQKGAQAYVNYCLPCHSASFMRYGRLTDIGFKEEDIKAAFVPPGAKIGDTMGNAMKPADAKAWFGVLPPDLSVIARARGTDWLYTYLRGFYVDETKPTGWNNLVFKDVGMPHVLWQLSGSAKLVEKAFASQTEAESALAKTRGVAEVIEKRQSGQDGKDTVQYFLRAVEPGKGAMLPEHYDAYVADLVNFLDYLGEPMKNQRIALGYMVLAFLLVLFVFAYLLKREYWKDVH